MRAGYVLYRALVCLCDYYVCVYDIFFVHAGVCIWTFFGMCVYVYVLASVYMFVSMYTFKGVCVYYVSSCMYTHTCTLACIPTHARTHAYNYNSYLTVIGVHEMHTPRLLSDNYFIGS